MGLSSVDYVDDSYLQRDTHKACIDDVLATAQAFRDMDLLYGREVKVSQSKELYT